MDSWITCARIITASEPIPQNWASLASSAKFVRQTFPNHSLDPLYVSANAIHLGAQAATIDVQPWSLFEARDLSERVRQNAQAVELIGTIVNKLVVVGRVLAKKEFINQYISKRT